MALPQAKLPLGPLRRTLAYPADAELQWGKWTGVVVNDLEHIYGKGRQDGAGEVHQGMAGETSPLPPGLDAQKSSLSARLVANWQQKDIGSAMPRRLAKEGAK